MLLYYYGPLRAALAIFICFARIIKKKLLAMEKK